MGRYKYSKKEKEILKVLGMQKEKTDSLSADIAKQTEELDNLKARMQALASDLNIELPSEPVYAESQELHIKAEDIPSWEELVRESEELNHQPEIEDFLTEQEIRYCQEDIERINREFSHITKLNKVDVSFLIIATALQTLRWIVINNLRGDLGETIDESTRESNKVGDKRKKDEAHDYNKKQKDRKNKESNKGYPTWKDIIFGQYERIDGAGKVKGRCPYDAQDNGPDGFDDGGKGSHRVNTLGHDPILGWVFGTANIMTCSITLSKRFDFNTYRVLYPGALFGERMTMLQLFREVYESLCEDKFRLPAAIFAQGAHLRSDKYTSRGLPVPLLEVFSKDLAGKLYNEHYDALCLARDAKTIGFQAAISIIINMLISLTHGLFYNQDKDGERELYEVRTRKILLYSNLLSSSGNIAYAAVTEDWGKLDVGGIIVTISRLFSDIRFITRIKEEFIQRELDKNFLEEMSRLDQYFY